MTLRYFQNPSTGRVVSTNDPEAIRGLLGADTTGGRLNPRPKCPQIASSEEIEGVLGGGFAEITGEDFARAAAGHDPSDETTPIFITTLETCDLFRSWRSQAEWLVERLARYSPSPFVIAVDFDETLYLPPCAYPRVGEPNHPLIAALKWARARGCKLILDTCRTGDALLSAVTWCNEHGLGFDAVNENLPERIELYGGDTRKVSADLYVDRAGFSPELFVYAVQRALSSELGVSI